MNNNEQQELYSSPQVKVVVIKARQVLCASGNPESTGSLQDINNW